MPRLKQQESLAKIDADEREIEGGVSWKILIVDLCLLSGLATAATLPALLTPTPASAQRYRPDEGREIAPGVRRVDLTKRESEIPAYVTVSMRDNVYQPGSKSDNPAMPNDMVCHCLEGELQISQGPGKQFVAKTGDVWSCKKGMPEATENKGSTIAIMRVIDLIPPT